MKALILWAWSLWVYLWAKIHDAWYNIILCGRRKLAKVWDTIKINDDIYELPPRTAELAKDTHYEIIFVTCKIYDLLPAIQIMKSLHITADNTVFIQNAILPESIEQKISSFGKFQSISVFEWFRLVENILITNETHIWRKTNDSDIWKNIAKQLKKCGINCSTSKNINKIRAEKTIMNCSLNIMSAIYRKTFYEIFENENLHLQTKQIFVESYEVLSQRYTLDTCESLWKKFINHAKHMNHYATTYQDVVSGYRTEIPYLNWLIVDLGKEYNIPTPHNKKILREFSKIA